MLINLENSEEFEEMEGENRFDAMIRRIEMRKSKFYRKMNGKPANDKNLCKRTTFNHVATEEKINYLRDKLNAYKISFTKGSNVIYIDRDDIFNDSLEQFVAMDHQKVRTKDTKLCPKIDSANL